MRKSNNNDPYLGYKELTLRGIILGFLITIVFTASNVYLGLKVGLTFASSIPAAVLSMALLKFAKDSNILENNMVQTQASAAGTLSSVVFVIPALVMLGYWQGFPFWQITFICMSGGILGVLFTIPLRRVMVVNSDLPYPEGVAAAEILKAGNRHGVVANHYGEVVHDPERDVQKPSHIKEILYGGFFAAIVSFSTHGLRIFSDSASIWLKSGSSIFQVPFGFSLALLGAGSLIGMSAGIAIFVGLFITWGMLVPYYTGIATAPIGADIASFAQQVWTEKVRFIGAGTIGIAAIWTLITLFKPMMEGVKLSFAAYSNKTTQQHTPRADQDLSPKYIALIFLAMGVIIVATFYHFITQASLSPTLAWSLVFVVSIFILIIGFLIAAACGYMAGLVGSSSSPISGIGILAIMLFSVVILLFGYAFDLHTDSNNVQYFTALALFSTSAVIATAAISNDNLQDLKTGYLVHATPAKQQIALIIGCIAGALVIAPLLQLLYQAYGFAGALPRVGMDESQALSAPQASLMSLIAKGIFSHQLEWGYIIGGAILGAVLIAIDVLLKRNSQQRLSLPTLAVGLGIYLPPTISTPIFAGAVIFWLLKRHVVKQDNSAERIASFEQKSTLFAAGLIVGESLIGVALALLIVVTTSLGGSDSPLALNFANWDNMGQILGFVAFVTGVYLFIRRTTEYQSY